MDWYCFQELYKEKKECPAKKVDIDLKYNGKNNNWFSPRYPILWHINTVLIFLCINAWTYFFLIDEEIDGILQQMGRLLSPAGEELGDKIYKHVIGNFHSIIAIWLFLDLFLLSLLLFLQLKLKTRALKRFSTKPGNSSARRVLLGIMRSFVWALMTCIRVLKVISSAMEEMILIMIITIIAVARRKSLKLKLKIKAKCCASRIVKMVNKNSFSDYEYPSHFPKKERLSRLFWRINLKLHN